MSDELNLDPSLAYDSNPMANNNASSSQNILPNPYQQDRVTVVVDRQHFIHTRNALNNAFMSLSSAIDRAVKAYADHTDAVISGDHTLDVSGLLMPFNQITQFAQQFNPAFFPQYTNGNGQAPIAPMEGAPTPVGVPKGKRKRAYKQRDVNAPKRPLTAYFRFLREQRPVISAEIAETPGGENGKAGDISKIATERWRALTDAQRNPYKHAYQQELKQWEVETKAYRNGLPIGAVQLGAEDGDDVTDTPTAAPSHVVARADDDEDDDDDDDEDDTSSDDASSDDDSDEDEEPVAPAKAPTPPRKAPKSAKKAVTAAADPAPMVFTSFNPTGTAAPSSSGQKRKAEDDGSSKKKRGRPTKAEQEAAAAASQLVVANEPDVRKEKEKKKEKKRKSEAA